MLDDNTAVIGYRDGIIRIWRDNQQIGHFVGHTGGINAVVSAKGFIFSAGDDLTIK